MVKTTFETYQMQKTRVTQALLKEFSQYSIEDAQVARIVKEAKIARGAFYKYFDDLADAYLYLYRQAMGEIHMGFGSNLRKFDPNVFYQMTVNFIDKTENSKYRELIKLHLSRNRIVLHPDLGQASKQMLKLDAKTWSAMVLTHEAINLVLFDPEHRKQNLDRYKESLELLEKGS